MQKILENLDNFRISYHTFRNLEIFQNLSDFEIIFWLFLTINYLYRKYDR